MTNTPLQGSDGVWRFFDGHDPRCTAAVIVVRSLLRFLLTYKAL